MKKKGIGLASVTTWIVGFGMALSAYSDTTGYWRFEDGSSGSEIVTAASEVNGPSMNGEAWENNATNALYSSDVAGAYIYDPVANTYSANTGSMLSPGTTNNADSSMVVHDMSSLTNGSFTVEMFVKVAEDGGAPTFSASAVNRVFELQSDVDPTTSCNMQVGSSSSGSGTIRARLGSYSSDWDKDVTDYSTLMEDGNWHHLAIVATYTGSNTLFKLYGDYVLRGSYTPPDGTYAGKFTSADTNDFRFGTSLAANLANLDYFFDDVRLSDTDLSPSEFLQAVEEPVSTTVGYWRFEDGSDGAAIVSAASEANSPAMDGEQWGSNGTNVLYSSDVAGAFIYDPVTGLTNANTGSMLAPGTADELSSQIVAPAASALSNGSFTVEMFVKVDAASFTASAANRMFNLDGNVGCNMTVGANGSASPTIKCRLGTGADWANDIIDYSTILADGDWHHLAYVVSYDGSSSTFELFGDYQSLGASTYSGKFTGTSDLRFGISSALNISNIDFALDDVRLSDVALTTNQFLQVFTPEAPDTTAPDAPTGLAAEAGNNTVALNWDANVESDLAGYTVYRSTTSGSGYSSLASGLTTNTYADSSAVNGTIYYYVVTATDDSDNESGYSTEASARPLPTLGYWRFEDGSDGSEISTAASEVNSAAMAGEQWDSNGTNVLYSSDVAGTYIYDPVTGLTNANAGSMLAPGTVDEDNSQIVIHNLSGLVSGSWTLEMFVKAETDGGPAVFNGGSNNRLVNFDGNMACQVNVGANGTASSTYVKFRVDSEINKYSTVFLDGAWHHFAYVADYDAGTTNTTLTIYQDGVSVASGSASGEFTSSGDLRFGISGVYNGMSNIDWFLDDVRLSSGVLTTNEFLQAVAGQEPLESPTVSVSALSGGLIAISWPSTIGAVDSFTVLTNADLTNPVGWGDAGLSAYDDGAGSFVVTNVVGDESVLFYKLESN